jgi:hypothetical protein
VKNSGDDAFDNQTEIISTLESKLSFNDGKQIKSYQKQDMNCTRSFKRKQKPEMLLCDE